MAGNRAAAVRRLHRRKPWNESAGWGLALVAPTIIGLVILNIWPFFQTLWFSLTKYTNIAGPDYIGLQNYEKMLFPKTVVTGSVSIWQAAGNTLMFVLLTVPVGVFLALVLASLLNNSIRGRNVYRGIYFLPMVVAPAAVAFVWKWILNSDYGILNQFLAIFGIKGTTWISNPDTALLSCAIINIWSAVGYDLVLILAGLQSISRTYYEAAEIDGASGVQRFFHITIPMVSPTLFFVVLMRTMTSLKQFDTVYLLVPSRSNPAYRSAATLMTVFYREAFEKFNRGYASAIVVFSFVLISIFTVIQLIAEKKLVHYDS